MITCKDVQYEDSRWLMDLTKLVEKEIETAVGYISCEFGHPVFELTKIVFKDGSTVRVAGEHDIAYLVSYAKEPQPNMDDDTLQSLYDEANGEDDDE